MRRPLRLILVLPLVLALAACLDPTGTPMPPDEQDDDGKNPDQTGAIPVLVGDFA